MLSARALLSALASGAAATANMTAGAYPVALVAVDRQSEIAYLENAPAGGSTK